MFFFLWFRFFFLFSSFFSSFFSYFVFFFLFLPFSDFSSFLVLLFSVLLFLIFIFCIFTCLSMFPFCHSFSIYLFCVCPCFLFHFLHFFVFSFLFFYFFWFFLFIFVSIFIYIIGNVFVVFIFFSFYVSFIITNFDTFVYLMEIKNSRKIVKLWNLFLGHFVFVSFRCVIISHLVYSEKRLIFYWIWQFNNPVSGSVVFRWETNEKRNHRIIIGSCSKIKKIENYQKKNRYGAKSIVSRRPLQCVEIDHNSRN